VFRDDPQQVAGHCPGAAPHTGPDRTPIGHELIGEAGLAGTAARASDRSPVYRVAGQRDSVPGVPTAPARSPAGPAPVSGAALAPGWDAAPAPG
jgi:hypothetical protein